MLCLGSCYFSFSPHRSPQRFWILPVASKPSGRGPSAQKGCISALYGLSGKKRRYKMTVKRRYRNTAIGGFDCYHGVLSVGNTRERSEDLFRLYSGTEVDRKYAKGSVSESMRVS